MAFPFEPTQLRAQLRAFALSSVEDECAARIVKPLVLGFYHDQSNSAYLLQFRPSSPPIPVELPTDYNGSGHQQLSTQKRYTRKPPPRESQPGHAKKPSNGSSRLTEAAERRRSAVDSIITSDTIRTIDEEISDSLVTTISNEPSTKKKSRLKEKSKNPLTKLFQKSNRTESDADSSIDGISLDDDSDRPLSNLDSTHDVPDTRNVPYDGSLRKQNLVDGEQVIVTEMETGKPPTRQSAQETLESGFADDSFDELADEGTIDDELDQSSTDSFTDIEPDSMMEVGSIYEYTVPESYVLERADKSKFSGNTRRKGNNSSALLLGKSGKPLATNSLFAPPTEGALYKTSETRTDRKPSLLPKRSSFTFQKIYNAVEVHPEPKHSNLSMLIDSRYHSSNVNPLNYYSFVGSDIVDGAKRANIDIYVPPSMKPVFKDMQFTANLVITDCIGFILLALSKLPEYKDKVDIAFMDPNHWRLELIDEDGELYDSTFGVLDRTRHLASYNCPNLLALCRVTNPAEISGNEKQSPLPVEFKENLEFHKQKIENSKNPSSDADVPPPGPENLDKDSIEVKVSHLPDTSKNTFISFLVSSTMTVEQLIDHISHLYHVEPTRYSLAEVPQNKRNVSTLLIDDDEKDEFTKAANNSDRLGDLATNKFRLIPNLSQRIRPLTDINVNKMSYQETGITPSSSTFIGLGITPPVSTLGGKFKEMNIDSKDQRQLKDKKNGHRPSKSTSLNLADPKRQPLTLGDIIQGKGPQLPSNLNTIYFKWKVYRKKSPILNRIEKSLIIDGDYIHLAPTDDTNWKKNQYDNPFGQSSNAQAANGNTSSNYHHYLHHYNYSKYYNDTMMKTSSFHITQIIKLKQYKQTKNPNHFKIVIKKETEQGGKETVVKKKYDLEAENVSQCEEIIEKIKWALQVYNMNNMG